MIPEGTITQNFGGNANPFYHGEGLKGHTGTDSYVGYGSDIHSAYAGYCYSWFAPFQPANDGYVAMYLIVEQNGEVFEYSVGHCSDILVKPGDIITNGQLLGKEGNRGEVYSGNILITLDMQKAGDKRGSHRHNQKRVLRKVTVLNPNRQYVTIDGSTHYQKDGYYFEVPFYNNGYNGCVDMISIKPYSIFNKDLTIGDTNEDVGKLQDYLTWAGYLTIVPIDERGIYGNKTKQAVYQFQLQNCDLSVYEKFILRGSRFGQKSRQAII